MQITKRYNPESDIKKLLDALNNMFKYYHTEVCKNNTFVTDVYKHFNSCGRLFFLVFFIKENKISIYTFKKKDDKKEILNACYDKLQKADIAMISAYIKSCT